VVSIAEASVLAAVGLAVAKAVWDNRKDIGDIRRGLAVLIHSEGYDPEQVMGESPPVQPDGGEDERD
jgi:hypothetical protein